jgi:hypothetical protein
MSRPQFDQAFLKQIAVRLFLEPHFVLKFRKYLKPSYFKFADENGTLEAMLSLWFQKIDEGAKNPNFDSLYAWLQMQPDGPIREQTLEMLDVIRWDRQLITSAKSDHAFETFLQWLRAITFIDGHKSVKEDFDLGRYELSYEKLNTTLSKLKSIALDTVEGADWDTADAFLLAEANKLTNKFNFGIEDFDTACGFEEQTLNLFVGGTNGGKSMISVHLLAECVKQGKCGYFVFVEDRKSTIMRRVFANLTDSTIDQIKDPNRPPELTQKINDIAEKLQRYITCEFIYGCSPDFILERAKEHMTQRSAAGLPNFEVMCVDYLQHIAQFAYGEKPYEKLANAMARYKDFALQHKLVVFTHQQVNRSGMQEQNKDNLITLGELSTSFNAAFVCDTIISLNRSPEQKERNEAVFYVLKGREGCAERRYQVNTNFSCAQYLMSNYYRLDAMK